MSSGVVGNIDLAEILFTLFWVLFIGLVFYLRREDKREGYPLESERSEHVRVQGFPGMPGPKTFLLAHGGSVMAPRMEPPQREIAARPAAPYPGSPLVPTGDPMRDGVGPAAWADRSDTPDLTLEGEPRVVPLRVAADFAVAPRDIDPRGLPVYGADAELAGSVVDLWVDRAEPMVCYLEVELAGENNSRRVLLPFSFAAIDRSRNQIRVRAINAGQFAAVPTLAQPDRITLREEDRVCAYYAGGLLYAEPARQEPIF